MYAHWIERKKNCQAVVNSRLSGSPGVKHWLTCRVWLFLMLGASGLFFFLTF